MENTLTPGKSTIADAVQLYGGTSTARDSVLSVLSESLTDVYTPEGDGVVVDSYASDTVRVQGQWDWNAPYPLTALALGSDSIAALARWMPTS